MEFDDFGDDEQSFTPAKGKKKSKKLKEIDVTSDDMMDDGTGAEQNNPFFDGPGGDDKDPAEDDEEEPVGRKVLGPGEGNKTALIFDEDEMQRKYFKGRIRRRLSVFIMLLATLGFVMFVGGFGQAMWGDQDCIDEGEACDTSLELDQAKCEASCRTRPHLDGTSRTECGTYAVNQPCTIHESQGPQYCPDGCFTDGAPKCWCSLNSACDKNCSGEDFWGRLNHWWTWLGMFFMLVAVGIYLFFRCADSLILHAHLQELSSFFDHA